jgi:WD40 repeat protein
MLVWKAHRSRLRSLAFSPDGRRLVSTAGMSRFVWLWEAATGRHLYRLSDGDRPMRLAAFHPGGRHVIAIRESRGGVVWELGTRRTVAAINVDQWQEPDALAVSPIDGRVVLRTRYSLSEWTVPTERGERPTNRSRPLPDTIHFHPLRMAFSPRGRFFCLVERNLELYDPETLRRLHTFVDPGGANASAVAFTPDESRVVAAFGHRALLWRLDEPRARPVVLRGHALLVKAVGFLPGGETVLTAGMDGTARLWDANTGQELRAFDWGIGKVRVAAIAPDGLTAAAGGEKGQIVVWDVEE